LQIIDHLDGAYCPMVAQESLLTDTKKSVDIKLLNEQPLQPGLSMPWEQNGYGVAAWLEAELEIANPPMASNAKNILRITPARSAKFAGW
jgi:hypothetical protein